MSSGFLLKTNTAPSALGSTDGTGEFGLTLRDSGEYYARASAPGWAPASDGPIPIEYLEGLDGLELELTRAVADPAQHHG